MQLYERLQDSATEARSPSGFPGRGGAVRGNEAARDEETERALRLLVGIGRLVRIARWGEGLRAAAMHLYPWFGALREAPLSETFEQDERHERQVGLWRIALALVIGVVPALGLLRGTGTRENLIGLAGVAFAVLYSLAVLLLLKAGRRASALKFATVTLDVSLVSAMMLGFLVSGQGIIAANSQVTYVAYYVVLALIARRYDVRLAAYGGALLVLQYSVILLLGRLVFGVPDLPSDPVYGSFDWPNQVGRALLLVLAACLMVNTVASGRRLRKQSVRDPLLGIFNRRYFEEVLALEFDRCRKARQALTVVMMDVDRFKEYNDRHGHQKGDRVLTAVSDYLLRNLRRNDVLARYGGDEFVCLLLETAPDGASVTLSRLQERMGRWLSGLEDDGASLSLSFGLASLAESDRSPAELLARADRHLYLAKTAGGGVVCDEEGRIVPREEVDSDAPS
jgi:diguanylate cyclase (GGDEF)-like protein